MSKPDVHFITKYERLKKKHVTWTHLLNIFFQRMWWQLGPMRVIPFSVLNLFSPPTYKQLLNGFLYIYFTSLSLSILQMTTKCHWFFFLIFVMIFDPPMEFLFGPFGESHSIDKLSIILFNDHQIFFKIYFSVERGIGSSIKENRRPIIYNVNNKFLKMSERLTKIYYTGNISYQLYHSSYSY